jgi:excisionase family DNA binding protein
MADMSTVTTDWITVAEAAERMACSSRTVLRLAEAGKVRKVQINSHLFLVHTEDIKREAKNPASHGRPRGT